MACVPLCSTASVVHDARPLLSCSAAVLTSGACAFPCPSRAHGSVRCGTQQLFKHSFLLCASASASCKQGENPRFFLAEREKKIEHAPLKTAGFLPPKRKKNRIKWRLIAQSPRGLRKNRGFAAQNHGFCATSSRKKPRLRAKIDSFFSWRSATPPKNADISALRVRPQSWVSWVCYIAIGRWGAAIDRGVKFL